MQNLFETEPQLDKHIVGIVNQILLRLPNNSPKQDSKCYLRVANYVNELYSGTFLINNKFSNVKDKLFNMENVSEQIREVKGDWLKTRILIINALNHLEEAKKPEKMPWNKTYLNKISFAKFFNAGYDEFGQIDCPFIHLVNPPKDSYSFTSDLTIENLKVATSPLIRENALKFCKRYFKMKSYQLNFWYSMVDWSRWFRNFRERFPNTYNEFLISCKNGNPFDDFSEYLINSLKAKQGEHPVINDYHFKLHYKENMELCGYFKFWLVKGMESGKFAMLKNLPKPVNYYYSDESFVKKTVKKEKVVIDLDDVIF